MTTPFKKLSLSDQVAVFLQRDIMQGAWNEWLPHERELARKLGVSRNTLRNALSQLKQYGVIETVHRQGNRILGPAVSRSSGNDGELRSANKESFIASPRGGVQNRTVNCLCPEHFDEGFYYLAYRTDRLREHFYRQQTDFHVIRSIGCYTSRPERYIKKLVETNPADCWVVFRARKSLQAWLHRHQIPCLLIGSAFEEFDLPNVDVDYEAGCRHAGAVIARRGHESIIYLMRQPERAGDTFSLRGFVKGVKEVSPRANVERIDYVNETQFLAKLQLLTERANAPTALFIDQPEKFLLALTSLINRGFRIPQDLSLVSRRFSPEFSHVVPTPTHYFVDDSVLAKKVFAQTMHLLKHSAYTEHQVRILPDFIEGATLAAPRSTPELSPVFSRHLA